MSCDQRNTLVVLDFIVRDIKFYILPFIFIKNLILMLKKYQNRIFYFQVLINFIAHNKLLKYE